jgi:hypothetical protein
VPISRAAASTALRASIGTNRMRRQSQSCRCPLPWAPPYRRCCRPRLKGPAVLPPAPLPAYGNVSPWQHRQAVPTGSPVSLSSTIRGGPVTWSALGPCAGQPGLARKATPAATRPAPPITSASARGVARSACGSAPLGTMQTASATLACFVCRSTSRGLAAACELNGRLLGHGICPLCRPFWLRQPCRSRTVSLAARARREPGTARVRHRRGLRERRPMRARALRRKPLRGGAGHLRGRGPVHHRRLQRQHRRLCFPIGYR